MADRQTGVLTSSAIQPSRVGKMRDQRAKMQIIAAILGALIGHLLAALGKRYLLTKRRRMAMRAHPELRIWVAYAEIILGFIGLAVGLNVVG
ncbi:hypothetical protein [Halotalea alkalilenta]|nr:hypothetical protein [Halotalea alkalilenta]